MKTLLDIKKVITGIKDRELSDWLLEIATVDKISKCIYGNGNLDPGACFNRIIDVITELLEVDLCSLMLIDDKEKVLIIRAAKGLENEIIKNTRVKTGEGISGWVLQNGQPLLIKDITNESGFQKRNARYYTNSLLSIPLKVEDYTFGVINFNNKISREVFKDEDLKLILRVNDFLSSTIKNLLVIEELGLVNRKKTEFISNVAHELKISLNYIEESINYLLNVLINGKGEIKISNFRDVNEDLGRLRRLINNLLNISLSEIKPQRIYHKELIDIKELIRHTIGLFNFEAENKEISIRAILPPEPVAIWGDRDGLIEVLMNLIDNAIKYSDKKGEVRVILENNESNITVSVIDKGRGIPKEGLKHIFDRYYRVDSILAGRVDGKGLGLPIIKEIIQLHNGQIMVESRVGRGSKFTFTIPKDNRKVISKENFLMDKKIIVIDDDLQIREMMGLLLERYGAHVISAENGIIGLEKVKVEKPDLVILDLLLPKMDGYKVCRMLKFDKKFHEIPVIIFSARFGDMYKELAKESGADLYIDKSTDPQTLIENIKRFVN